jgi:hypothetical protein
MKKLVIPVLVALMIGVTSGSAQTTNVTGVTTNVLDVTVVDRVQTGIVANIPISFSGTLVGTDGKTAGKISTKDLGDTNVSAVVAEITAGQETNTALEIITDVQIIETNGVTNTAFIVQSNTVVTAGTTVTESFTAIVGSLITTNEVPIGGGTNLLVVVKQAKLLLLQATSLSTSNDKLWAIWEGEVGTNAPGVIRRQVLVTGSTKGGKLNLKTQGVWVDGETALKSGTIKNAK